MKVVDRTVEVFERTVKVVERTVKVVDRTVKVVERTVKVVDRTVPLPPTPTLCLHCEGCGSHCPNSWRGNPYPNPNPRADGSKG